MLRYCAIALVALVPAAGLAQAGGKAAKDVRITGTLKRDDPRDRKRGTPSQIHLVKMKAGNAYAIDMSSRQFDSYLRLEDSAGKELDEDDDSGGMLDARIIFTCPKDGEYRVICTSFNQGAAGQYVLTVKRSVQEVRAAASLEALVGKAAPDFQGDFAVNGKLTKLSDLKGKVVLLAFWEVRSAPSAAAFPQLRAWSKAYRADGLEVVGVTYYHFEIGHKVGFDKATGKLKDLAKADKQSEQAMLRDFAAYHQLDFPLLALPKQEALRAFDTYVVNGVPQFVLIDRAGMIRMIRVGGEAGNAKAVEDEIKTLLAAK
jgi:peroxiredoxin